MNRVKYLDGKYSTWEEIMLDFNETQKYNKSKEAYKTHLNYLQHGFPDKITAPTKTQVHSFKNNNKVPVLRKELFYFKMIPVSSFVRSLVVVC
jgi:hypothetical protein